MVFLETDVQLFQPHCWKDYFFSTVVLLLKTSYLCVVCVCVFISRLCPIPCIRLSVLTRAPQSLDYCSLIMIHF